MGGGSKFLVQLKNLLTERRHARRLAAALIPLALLVGILTFAFFRSTAQTKTHTVRVLECHASGVLAHTHNDDCYDEDGRLVCPLPERPAHTHTDACYTLERVLSCGKEEGEAHTHSDDCYTDEETLICGKEESEGHTHTEDCYEEVTEPVCGMEEGAGGHEHTDACYEKVRGELTCENDDPEHEHSDDCYEWTEELACGMEEGAGGHEHSESCYETRQELTCGKEESEPHTHTEACYETRRVLTCTLPELDETHVHTESCYTEEEVASCGLEETTGEHIHGKECFVTLELTDEEVAQLREKNGGMQRAEEEEKARRPVWEADFDDLDLEDETPAGRLLLVAETQLGYRENDENYIFDSDGETRLPYSVYGDWYGTPYAAWNTLFVGFCLHYAEIDEHAVPFAARPERWIDALRGAGLFLENDGTEVPEPGDIAFVLSENEERGETGILAGIVSSADFEASIVEEARRLNGRAAAAGAAPADAAAQADETARNAEPAPAEAEPVYTLSALRLICGDGTVREIKAEPETLLGFVKLPETTEEPPVEKPVLTEYTVMEGGAGGVHVRVEVPVGAFNEDVELFVRRIAPARVEDAVNRAAGSDVTIVGAVDITFLNEDGDELEPLLPIRVYMTSDQVAETENTSVVHVDRAGKGEVVEEVENEGETLSFDAGSFSIYVIVGTVIEKNVLTTDGHLYHVSVTCPPESGVPEDARLEAFEVIDGFTVDGMSYPELVAGTESALGMEEGSAGYIRLFDLKIVDAEGMPIEIAAPVEVKITLADAAQNSLSVVHFASDGVRVDPVENTTEIAAEGQTVSFEAEGFSVYAVIEAPAPASVTLRTVADIGELAGNYDDSEGFYFSYNNVYFTNKVNTSQGVYTESASRSSAAAWFFEAGGEENSYYVYTIVDGLQKYMYQISANDNKMGLSDTKKTLFELSDTGSGKFLFKVAGQKRWVQHSKSGGGIRLYTDHNNAANSEITLTYISSTHLSADPYGLSGRSFGIAFNDESTVAAAMSAVGKTVSGQTRLEASDMLIRPDVVTNSGLLLVAENSDIQEWTFESVREDRYYLSTLVGEEKKYLTVNGTSLTLEDAPDESRSLVCAAPGTGANSGKWHFTVNGYSLNLANARSADGFNAASGNGNSTWLNLVDRSALTEADFVYYSARKLSVSDDSLSASNPEKAQVILYTRVWNDDLKRYEFYAVDHDGSLVRVYDSGDLVNWVGNRVNSALWEFTEYTYEDGTPNYYYELENTAYRGTFLAPQAEGIVFDHTVGVNLNGRREGFDYTTVVAWDDAAYAYSGLKVVVDENGGKRVVTCPLDEAEDFYFATVIPPVQPADPTTSVETVNGNRYGISMKMVDFNNALLNERDSVQNPFFGSHPFDARNQDEGLLSTDLVDGYPVTTAHTGSAGRSLSELFTGMTTVDHLFIQSVYNESGYFEYDSTQNFAHLNDDGTFTVYDQLGAIGTTRSDTREHGQFMPFNDISAETGYALDVRGDVITNRTSVEAVELPDSDPRKGEPLYSIPLDQADYFFGMELSASFTQTPNGLDNWGHDIIFEFTGDDDFWFYVDGELVLDLGGIHSALGGSVNFRTGEVVNNRTRTTLYELFRKNYLARGMTAAEVSAKLDEVFEEKTVDGKTVHIFPDYSTHRMKMFYMERGAGASNLKMRFNLASVQPGTVELAKKLKGALSPSNSLIQYPYQIWYETVRFETNPDGTYAYDESGDLIPNGYNSPVLMEQAATSANPLRVVYKGTNTLVPYRDSLTFDGLTYENVFLLRPGETAVIHLPEHTYRYKIIECGIDTDVYTGVEVNGSEIFGKPYANTDGGAAEAASTTCYPGTSNTDFGIDFRTTDERPRVEYTNAVPPEAMRTLSFKKAVYDQSGVLLTDAQAALIDDTFNFRLYLGNKFADPENLPLANMYAYYVKDPAGHYCTWNSAAQRFDALPVSNIESLLALDEDTLGSATFTTSMNGAISKIPAGYTVELHDLIVGTQFKVEERDGEIPRGYTRRASDGYVRTDLAENYVYYTEGGAYDRHVLTEWSTATAEPISDTIRKLESPMLEVRNQEGWGLTAKKVWTDRDFTDHDPIYLAVYLQRSEKDEILLTETVRQLQNADSEAYFFFPDLQQGGTTYTFDRFIIREVSIDAAHISAVDSEGRVTVDSAAHVTPIENGDPIRIGAAPKAAGGTRQEETYTVSYTTGASTGRNSNIRIDTVTNARPGIVLNKQDLGGNALAGAVFTLVDDTTGRSVGAASYTSDADGRITIAYLSSGKTYTLTETVTPSGFTAPDTGWSIAVSAEGAVSVTGPDGLHELDTEPGGGMTAAITIKNRPSSLQFLKVDLADSGLLAGAHFALYPAVWSDSDHAYIKGYTPRSGYEDLISDVNGVIAGLDGTLKAGTYYLEETAAPDGYGKLSEDLNFTLGTDGRVTILNPEPSPFSLGQTLDPASGQASITVTIANGKVRGVSILKVDMTHRALAGARFDLYRVDGSERVEPALYTGLVSGSDGLIAQGGETVFSLPVGVYHLIETSAPTGYNVRSEPVVVTVWQLDNPGVTYDEGSNLSMSGSGLSYDSASGVYTLKVSNSTGYALPSTGGSGTHALAGMALLLIAGAGVYLKKKRSA